MPDAVKEGMIGYTWTWCPSRKTFILFGGIPGTDPTAPYLHEFQPKGSNWTVMVSQKSRSKGIITCSNVKVMLFASFAA